MCSLECVLSTWWGSLRKSESMSPWVRDDKLAGREAFCDPAPMPSSRAWSEELRAARSFSPFASSSALASSLRKCNFQSCSKPTNPVITRLALCMRPGLLAVASLACSCSCVLAVTRCHAGEAAACGGAEKHLEAHGLEGSSDECTHDPVCIARFAILGGCARPPCPPKDTRYCTRAVPPSPRSSASPPPDCTSRAWQRGTHKTTSE